MSKGLPQRLEGNLEFFVDIKSFFSKGSLAGLEIQ